MKKLIAALAVTLAATLPASAQSRLDTQFRTWLERDLWPEARRSGVSRATFDSAFDGVRPDTKLPDLVLPGQKPEGPRKQHQAEFGSPGSYFRDGVVSSVTNGGRSRMASLSRQLSAAERRYGVPGPIILAIWGRESGYGAAKIPHDAFQVLATKAWAATRKDMFRKETIGALQMLESGHVTRSMMKSSWAGALGQPQFLPTSFLKHAVDFDGDGKIDIWSSQADTIGSIGKYLADYGWQKGRDWGFEVTVPESVSCALEGPDQGKRFSAWADLGVKRVNGKPFPRSESGKEGFLLMPAGRSGPAFIVTKNFYVLKSYNESDLYALFIGHNADRTSGGNRNFATPWGQVGGLYRSDVAAMQRGLEKKGYDVGGADGLPGFKTRRSIGDWQSKNGMAPTCFPSKWLVEAVK